MRHIYGPGETDFDTAESRRSYRQRARVERKSNKLQEFMVSIVGIVWAVVLVMAVQLGLRSFGFGSEGIAIRHLVAATGCGAATEVGLAPAHRGDPGYWSWLDHDNNGMSCEPAALPSRTDVHRG